MAPVTRWRTAVTLKLAVIGRAIPADVGAILRGLGNLMSSNRSSDCGGLNMGLGGVLEFEKPLVRIEREIAELELVQNDTHRDLSEDIRAADAAGEHDPGRTRSHRLGDRAGGPAPASARSAGLHRACVKDFASCGDAASATTRPS